jgi:hypothetical protein
MTTTFSHSVLSRQTSDLAGFMIVLAEPGLAIGAALFWVAALQLVALALLVVKIWDTVLALASASGIRPKPLILRCGLPRSGLAIRHSARAAHI